MAKLRHCSLISRQKMAIALAKNPPQNSFQVAIATESDAQEIHAIVNEAYKRDFFRYPERARATYEKIHAYFSDPEHTWYVIKDVQGKVAKIACAVLYSTDKAVETLSEGNIHMLAARKVYWGKKLSALLLQTVEERAVQDKKTSIRLIVANTSPGLIKLYKRHGYRLTGERFALPMTSIQPKYQQKNKDGSFKICCLHMQKNLNLIGHQT